METSEKPSHKVVQVYKLVSVFLEGMHYMNVPGIMKRLQYGLGSRNSKQNIHVPRERFLSTCTTCLKWVQYQVY